MAPPRDRGRRPWAIRTTRHIGRPRRPRVGRGQGLTQPPTALYFHPAEPTSESVTQGCRCFVSTWSVGRHTVRGSCRSSRLWAETVPLQRSLSRSDLRAAERRSPPRKTGEIPEWQIVSEPRSQRMRKAARRDRRDWSAMSSGSNRVGGIRGLGCFDRCDARRAGGFPFGFGGELGLLGRDLAPAAQTSRLDCPSARIAAVAGAVTLARSSRAARRTPSTASRAAPSSDTGLGPRHKAGACHGPTWPFPAARAAPPNSAVPRPRPCPGTPADPTRRSHQTAAAQGSAGPLRRGRPRRGPAAAVPRRHQHPARAVVEAAAATGTHHGRTPACVGIRALAALRTIRRTPLVDSAR